MIVGNKKTKWVTWLFFLVTFFGAGLLFAKPVLTFTPLTATTVTLSVLDSAIIQYLVTNQSKTHTLLMNPLNGVTTLSGFGRCSSPFVLGKGDSCVLTLQVDGAAMGPAIHGGPVICQVGSDGAPSPNFCYRPAADQVLDISLFKQSILYSATSGGWLYFSQNWGQNWRRAATQPSGTNSINSIFATAATVYVGSADGFVYYSLNQGSSWSATSSPDGSSINSVLVHAGRLYAATNSGFIYYSINNGRTWRATAAPDGSAVNGISVSDTALYAVTANGFVYYSNLDGTVWTSINGLVDGSAVNTIFVSNTTLYVGTANEYVYSSTSLTGGGVWTAVAQTVHSLFVDSISQMLYAGTQGGYVYSLSEGLVLGFVEYATITSLFVLNYQ